MPIFFDYQCFFFSCNVNNVLIVCTLKCSKTAKTSICRIIFFVSREVVSVERVVNVFDIVIQEKTNTYTRPRKLAFTR